MTEKSFIKWLRRFLDKTDIKHIEFTRRISPTYNHSTALKEIYDKLEKIQHIYIYTVKFKVST